MKKSGKHEHRGKNKLGSHDHIEDDDEIDFKIHFKGDGEFLPDLVVGKKTIKKINRGKKPSKKKDDDDDDDKKEMKKLIDEIDEELDKFNLTKEVIKRSSGSTPPIYIPTPSMSPTNISLGGLRDYNAQIQQGEVRLREWFENRFNEPYQNILDIVEELRQRQQEQEPHIQPVQPQPSDPLPPSVRPQIEEPQPQLQPQPQPLQPQPRPIARRPLITHSQHHDYLPPIAEEEDNFQDLLDQLMPPTETLSRGTDPLPIETLTRGTDPIQSQPESIPHIQPVQPQPSDPLPTQPQPDRPFEISYEPDEPPLFDPRRPPEQPQIRPMINLAEIQQPSQIPIYDFGGDYEMIDYDRDIPSLPVGEDFEEEQKRKDREQKKLMEQIVEDVEHIASPQLQTPQLTLEHTEEFEDEYPPELISTPALQLEVGTEEIEDDPPEPVFADLVDIDIARKEELDDKYAVNRNRDDLRDTYGLPPHIIKSDSNTQKIMRLIERATIRQENPLSTSQNQDIVARVIDEVLKENNKSGKAPNKDNLPTKLFLRRLTEAYNENVLQSVPYGVGTFANVTQPYQYFPTSAEEHGTLGEEIKKPSPRTQESLEELYELEKKRRENEETIIEGHRQIDENKHRIELLLKDREKEMENILFLEEDREEIEKLIAKQIQPNLDAINAEMEEQLMRGAMVEDVEEQLKHEQRANELQKELEKYTSLLKEMKQNLEDIKTELKSKEEIDHIEANIEVLQTENLGIEDAIKDIRKKMN